MSKVKITYIGEKLRKRDTVAGTRLVFPQHVPVEVDEAIAYRFLDYPDVWVEAEKADDLIKAKEEKAKKLAELEAERKAAIEREALDNCIIVKTEDGERDITKFSSKQLETLCISEDLEFESKDKKPVLQFAKNIRTALEEKYKESEDGE